MAISSAKITLAKRRIKQALIRDGHKISHFHSRDIRRMARVLAKEQTWNELRKSTHRS